MTNTTPDGHRELQAADALVTCDSINGTRWVLLVERHDGHDWALPGGPIEDGEDATTAALRGLAEETGLTLDATSLLFARIWDLPARNVPDPRASRESWIVTTPVRVDLDISGHGALPAVKGRDDARRAAWLPVDPDDGYDGLVTSLSVLHGGQVFPAHEAMLRELADGQHERPAADDLGELEELLGGGDLPEDAIPPAPPGPTAMRGEPGDVTQAPAPVQGVTHVLHWVPPYLTDGYTGWWVLQDLDSYTAGAAQDGPELAAPRESLRRDLAQWAGSQLGYPVLLRLDYATITCLRALRWRRREPVWYVQADPFAAVRRVDDERDLFVIDARGDSIADIETAATTAARELYGPDSELCTDHIAAIYASWDEERGRYRARVTVRCLNYHAIAAAGR
jgi:ADP-ribose pyrophosphatase YjhB (NUDIX family)